MAEAGDGYDQVGPAASRRIITDGQGKVIGGGLRPKGRIDSLNANQDPNVGYGITANTPAAAPEAPQAVLFKCGDVVHPKAAMMPYMTVESVSWDGHSKRVHTVWFDCQNKLNRDSFDPDVLVLGKPLYQR